MLAPFDQSRYDQLAPFARHLGVELLHWGEGQSEVAFEPGPEHLNTHGMAHGGVLMTLLDIGLSRAARDPGMTGGSVTIEMKTSFMRAASGPLRCQGRLLHRTATLAFAEATVLNASGQPCAHATGTFKFVRQLPEQARAARRSD